MLRMGGEGGREREGGRKRREEESDKHTRNSVWKGRMLRRDDNISCNAMNINTGLILEVRLSSIHHFLMIRGTA